MSTRLMAAAGSKEVLSYQQTVLADNPVSFFPLDEPYGTVAQDRGSLGNHGTYAGTYNQVSRLLHGSILGLDVSGSGYVVIPDLGNYSPAVDGSMSIELLFSGDNGAGAFISKGAASNYEWAFVGNGGGAFVFQMWDLAGNIVYEATTDSSAYTVMSQHVVITIDTATPRIEMWVDGISAAIDTTSAGGTLGNGAAPVNIGRRGDNTAYVDAALACVAFYDYVLTEDRILAHYNALRPTPIISSDTFDRSDNASSLGTADTGEAWTAQYGTFGIINNTAYVSATVGGGTEQNTAVIDCGASDVDVKVTFSTVGDFTGIVFRGVDESNYWIANINASNLQLYKRVAGTFTEVANFGTGAAWGNGDTMRVVAIGSCIEVFRNDISRGVIFDTVHQTATKVGIRIYGATPIAVRLDNFMVREIPEPGVIDPDNMAGQILWLDASDTSTITTDAGGVTVWADKSPAGNDVVKHTDSNSQPEVIAAELNGLGVLRFESADGTRDLLLTSDPGYVIGQPFTVFVVFKGTTRNILSSRDISGSGGTSVYGDTQGELAIYAGTTYEPNAMAYTGWRIGVWLLNGASSKIWQDGLLLGTGDSGTNGFRGFALMTYGGSATQPMIGDLAEIQVFNANLSDVEREAVEAYLMEKWFPFGIPGMTLWLDASDTSTITDAGAGAVSGWTDKSGSNFHVTQATESSRPTTGVNTINGLNVLTFDGSADYLIRAANAPLNNASDGSFTVFAVGRSTTIASNGCLLDADGQGGGRVAQYLRRNGAFMSVQAFDSASGFPYSERAMSANTVHLFRSVSNGTATVQAFVDGVGGTAASYATPPQWYDAADGLAVGRFWGADSSFWTGDIAEIIAFNYDLSANDIVSIEAYLADKWGIPFQPSLLQDLVAWYDFSDESSITIATGISQANDRSGNGNHLVQATTGQQPVHATDANLGGGSLKVAKFDGTDDLLSTSANLAISSFTQFVVAYKPTTATVDVLTRVDGASLFYNGQLFCFPSTSPSQAMTVTEGVAVIATVTRSTTVASGRTNGTTRFTGAPAANGTNEPIFVGAETGGANPGDWYVGEMIVYDRVLDATEIADVETYLADKWGITI